MLKITPRLLIEAGLNATQAKAFAEPLSAACALFDISTPRRLAAFLAQCSHESRGFAALEEDLFYRRPDHIAEVFKSRIPNESVARSLAGKPEALANVVYAGKNGNGEPGSGDGWRYRGRGLLGLTGRANYAAAAAGLQRPYIEKPELVCEPSDAALTAAWYWSEHGLNALADKGDTAGITRRINGPAMLGLSQRTQLYLGALDALTRAQVGAV
jgi:putative chitinase